MSVVARVRWTAEDYDVIEELAAKGLSSAEIAKYVVPPTTGQALAAAAQRAGIRLRGRGRPAEAERDTWRRVERELLGIDEDQQALARIEAFAARLGYDVVATKKPPEILASSALISEVSEGCAPGGSRSSLHGGER